MAYILAGTTIRNPTSIDEANSTQVAQNRTLGGSIARDYFGSNKRVWTCSYNNVNTSDYAVINSIYSNYLSTASAVSWQITETNYSISATSVHVDLLDRGFSVKGNSYLSDFTLILTEA